MHSDDPFEVSRMCVSSITSKYQSSHKFENCELTPLIPQRNLPLLATDRTIPTELAIKFHYSALKTMSVGNLYSTVTSLLVS